MKEMEEDKVSFQPGEVLFRRGDPGGDLFFISEGTVEIFIEKDETAAVLSRMKSGEVIGLLTCLDNLPRSASARAVDKVVAKKVSYDQIKKAVIDMPKWMTVVLKEFRNRLEAMNDSYLDQTVSLKKQSENLFTGLMEGKLVCGLLRSMASYWAIKVDGVDYVVIDTAVAKLAETMDVEPARIKGFLQLFIHAGLLVKTIEPDHKKEVIPLSAIAKLDEFINFLKTLKLKKVKKMVDTFLPDKTIRICRALPLYAKQAGLSATSQIELTVDELVAKLEKATGTTFELEGLEPLFEIGLLTWEKAQTDEKCGRFNVNIQSLVRTINNIVAYRKLARLSEADVDIPVDDAVSEIQAAA